MEIEAPLGLNRLVHLDLKRAPIKVEYFEKIFPLFHSWGATGILVEWEDTFPYTGNLSVIGSHESEAKAYTEEDVDRISLLAEQYNLQVIPLVQTMGHLEFVLRHEPFSEMREMDRYPSCLCPSHPKALQVVNSMVDQVAAKVPKSTKYIHIGADEVWHLGVCSVCSEQDKHVLLLNHVTAVLKHVKEHYPHLRPIMWDDMLRNIDAHLLEEFGISALVDPMIWLYDPSPAFHLPNDLWQKYEALFKNIWVASAFKGATGSCQILPVIQHHVSNHEQWIAELNKHPRISFAGIALTGWSRYDHYATLCELLPTALPSLALCMRVWMNRSYDPAIHKSVAEELGYTTVPLALNPYPRPMAVAPELSFPGWKIAAGVEWLANLKAKHQSIVNCDQVNTWLTPWHTKHNMINPMQIQGLVPAIFELGEEWDALETYMTNHMTAAYYDATVDEWIFTNIHALKHAAKLLFKNADRQMTESSTTFNANHWTTKHLKDVVDHNPKEVAKLEKEADEANHKTHQHTPHLHPNHLHHNEPEKMVMDKPTP